MYSGKSIPNQCNHVIVTRTRPPAAVPRLLSIGGPTWSMPREWAGTRKPPAGLWRRGVQMISLTLILKIAIPGRSPWFCRPGTRPGGSTHR